MSYTNPPGKCLLIPNLNCGQLANIYNEMWHAWWEEVLNKSKECEWLMKEILKVGIPQYTGPPLNLHNSQNASEMIEEAMSETASSWINDKCNKIEPNYKSNAKSPEHNEFPSDKWYGNAYADKVIDEALYELTVYALTKGCAPK